MDAGVTVRRTMTGILAGILAFAGTVVSASAPASADVPPSPAAVFTAQACPGSTWAPPEQVRPDDVTFDTGDVPDLTLVFGRRLADFNAGLPVVLYDAYGTNDSLLADGTSVAYPPLCTTRYVAGHGAVSEWMFCTNYHWQVCGGTNAAGELTGFHGEVLPSLGVVPRNPELTPDGVKIVSYLVENGHDYTGVGYFAFGAPADARADGDSYQRAALQVLVWCISDPVPAGETDPTELDRAATCDANMDAAEQQRIRDLVPDPVSALEFRGTPGRVAAGTVAEFALTTNLYGDPLTVTVTKGAGAISVLSGSATLVGDQLTVSGADPLTPSVVRIGVTASATSDLELTVSGVPSRQPRLSWYQSPGASATAVPCQVFAQFDESTALRVSAIATSEIRLAATGWAGWMPLSLGLTLLVLGALAAARASRAGRGGA